MKKLFYTVSMTLTLLGLISNLAFAEGAPTGESESVSAEVETPKARYSQRVVERGVMLPEMFDVMTTLKVGNVNFSPMQVQLKSTFGIVDGLEGRVEYEGFSFNDPKSELIGRTVTLGAKYGIWSMDQFSTGVEASLPIHIGKDKIVRNVGLGTPLVWFNNDMAVKVLGKAFQFSWAPEGGADMEIKADLPLMVGYQIYGNLWADVETKLGGLEYTRSKGEGQLKPFHILQHTPIELTGTYAVNDYVDVGALVGFTNVQQAAETFHFGLSFTIRGGRFS